MNVFPTEVMCNIYSRNILFMSVMLQLCTPKHGGGEYLDRAAHRAVTSIRTWDLPLNAQNLRWGRRVFIPLLWLARALSPTSWDASPSVSQRQNPLLQLYLRRARRTQWRRAAGGVNTLVLFHRQTFWVASLSYLEVCSRISSSEAYRTDESNSNYCGQNNYRGYRFSPAAVCLSADCFARNCGGMKVFVSFHCKYTVFQTCCYGSSTVSVCLSHLGHHRFPSPGWDISPTCTHLCKMRRKL